MFGKVFTITAFVAALSVQVHGHALVEPAIGVGKNGTGVRADVQRPSTKSPCGTVNVANVIKNSTAVFVDKDGVFSATGQNFNPYVFSFSSSSNTFPILRYLSQWARRFSSIQGYY